jgi:hypothetical protein
MITLTAFGDEISPDLEIQMDTLASEGIYYIDLRGVGGKNVLQLNDDEVAEIKKTPGCSRFSHLLHRFTDRDYSYNR